MSGLLWAMLGVAGWTLLLCCLLVWLFLRGTSHSLPDRHDIYGSDDDGLDVLAFDRHVDEALAVADPAPQLRSIQ